MGLVNQWKRSFSQEAGKRVVEVERKEVELVCESRKGFVLFPKFCFSQGSLMPRQHGSGKKKIPQGSDNPVDAGRARLSVADRKKARQAELSETQRF